MNLTNRQKCLLVLSAVVLFFVAAAILLEMTYSVPIFEKAHNFLNRPNLTSVLVGVIAALVLVLLLAGCLYIAFWHGSGKGYVRVKSGGGQLRISVPALENLVRKCLEGHPEIDVSSIQLKTDKLGLLVILHGVMPIGLDMPDAVTTLQQEIKDYLNACSGVTVHEVNVLVDNTSGNMDPSLVREHETSVPTQEPEEIPATLEEETLAEEMLLDADALDADDAETMADALETDEETEVE